MRHQGSCEDDLNTLPLKLQELTTTVTTPAIYTFGTLATGISILVITFTMVEVASDGRFTIVTGSAAWGAA